uniref:Uncharacterized protein n=1 Tax=Magallana gigas TaxID=29159 RepID=K1QCZ9_MAGGI
MPEDELNEDTESPVHLNHVRETLRRYSKLPLSQQHLYSLALFPVFGDFNRDYDDPTNPKVYKYTIRDNLDVITKPKSTQSEDLHRSRRFGYAEATTEERRPSPFLSNSETDTFSPTVENDL